MFGGVLAILIAIWVFRTALKAKTSNAILWTAGAVALFLAVQVLFINLNIFIIDGLGNDVGGEYDRDISDIGARVTSGGDTKKGFLGTILNVLYELMPLVMGCLSVAFVRTKYMLKEELNLKNLTSGITDVFIGIKNSFKTG